MVDTCVCCGEIVPEGRMVCPSCEAGLTPKKNMKPVEKTDQYVVIVISDRELAEAKQVTSLEAGVNYANKLLDELLEANDLNYSAGSEIGECRRATAEFPNAWVFNDLGAWDAFVTKL